MYGILISGLFTIVRYLLTQAVMKFAVFGVMAILLTEVLPAVIAALYPSLASGDGGIGSAFAAIGDPAWYFFEFFKVPQGLSLMLAADLAAFLTRRIPFLN
jgi:hypothetical protein